MRTNTYDGAAVAHLTFIGNYRYGGGISYSAAQLLDIEKLDSVALPIHIPQELRTKRLRNLVDTVELDTCEPPSC